MQTFSCFDINTQSYISILINFKCLIFLLTLYILQTFCRDVTGFRQFGEFSFSQKYIICIFRKLGPMEGQYCRSLLEQEMTSSAPSVEIFLFRFVSEFNVLMLFFQNIPACCSFLRSFILQNMCKCLAGIPRYLSSLPGFHSTPN